MAKIKGARKWMLPLCCVAVWGILRTSDAGAQARPFYEDKTIRIVDYGTAGGGSDLLARLVARHLPKQIPGNPQVVVQNMPGAAGAIAANYIYSVAKPDGLAVGLIAGGLYQAQLLGKPEIKFDWVKFGWIGTDQPNVTSLLFEAIPAIAVWMTSRRRGSPWYAPTAPPGRQTTPSSGFLRRFSGQSSSRCWVTKVREP